jgi:TPR repeat protein
VHQHNMLAAAYEKGNGVSKDETKAKQYCEKSAMAGCATARYNLGCDEANSGRHDRAIRHWLIAASTGEVDAVNSIEKEMVTGRATKDHYAQALRVYLKYLNEVKSDQRDRVAAYTDRYKYLV